MTIQSNVKKRRTHLGLHVSDLANMVGTSQCTLYNIENNKAKHVSFSLIQRLTVALKCTSTRDLFPGTMCPEVSVKDLRAHKPHTRSLVLYEDCISEIEEAPRERPLKVGERVRIMDGTLHERPYVGEVIEVLDRLFVVRHPIGFKECFLWDELDGCRVRRYVENGKETLQ